MKKIPKLEEYTDNDFIIIVYEEQELWQKDAIEYAKYLLKVGSKNSL